MQTQRGLKSFILKFKISRGRLALFIHFVPSTTTKCDLCEVGKSMIRLVPRPINEFLASLAYKN
jgi:hypothetical protein